VLGPHANPATMKAEPPGSSNPATFISPTTSTLLDREDFLASFVNDNTATDLSLDLTHMPLYYTSDSPTSSLSSPTTQFSFEDTPSSASSLTYTTATALSTETTDPFVGAFIPNNSATPFQFSGPLFATCPFLEGKPEPPSFVNPFESFGEMSYPPYDFKSESIHRSIEMPASPLMDQNPTFSRFPPYEGDISGSSFERSVTGTARPFQHSLPVFSSSYTSSSEETTSEAPMSPSVSKKPNRVSKQNKGIKCDHCGVDKTPLWRKVPHKENAYHWYVLEYKWSNGSNACGLYYKSNGHFRALEGESRVVRAKKARKSGDLQISHQFRAGPVTANRNVTCANCGTNNTVLWRKGPDGQSPLCNPCGLFYKLHGTHRSPEKRKEIHRRNRAGKKRFSVGTVNTWSSAEDGDDETESPITPVTPEFNFRNHQTQSQGFVKTEERDFPPPPQMSDFMPTPQYQYQWQSHSFQGRC